MTEITNKLKIKYKPWKVSALKDGKKMIFAEITEEDSDKRQAELQKDGWSEIKVICGKEAGLKEAS